MSDSAANRDSTSERQRIVKEYGVFIELRPPLPTRIEDASVLPHPKEEILSALLLEIARYGPQETKALRSCARCLAPFQPGVGREPLEFLGTDITKVSAPPLDDVKAWKEVAGSISAAAGKVKARFDQFNELVEEDLRQIDAQIDAAMALADCMPEEQKRKVLG